MAVGVWVWVSINGIESTPQAVFTVTMNALAMCTLSQLSLYGNDNGHSSSMQSLPNSIDSLAMCSCHSNCVVAVVSDKVWW